MDEDKSWTEESLWHVLGGLLSSRERMVLKHSSNYGKISESDGDMREVLLHDAKWPRTFSHTKIYSNDMPCVGHTYIEIRGWCKGLSKQPGSIFLQDFQSLSLKFATEQICWSDSWLKQILDSSTGCRCFTEWLPTLNNSSNLNRFFSLTPSINTSSLNLPGFLKIKAFQVFGCF